MTPLFTFLCIAPGYRASLKLAAALLMLGATVGCGVGMQLQKGSASDQISMDCTVYYTPRESGFVPGKGFDLHPLTHSGLHGRKFPADFLRAVQVEGHGLLAHPEDGLRYICYNGSWGYTDRPRGAKMIPLVPRRSCAMSFSNFAGRQGQWLQVQDKQLPPELTWTVWQVVDVGGGVGSHQIDLYWGEDDPHGPRSDVFRPAGTAFTGYRRAHFARARDDRTVEVSANASSLATLEPRRIFTVSSRLMALVPDPIFTN